MTAMLIPPETESGHNCNNEDSYSGILKESDGGSGNFGVRVMDLIS